MCRYQKTIVFVAVLSDSTIAKMHTAGGKNALGIKVPEQRISVSFVVSLKNFRLA